jgi:hypothetical protein
MNIEFDNIVKALTQAEGPCHLKETNQTEYIIELGFHYPEELVDMIYSALPGFNGIICGDSAGYTMVASARICGGPKRY